MLPDLSSVPLPNNDFRCANNDMKQCVR